VTKTTKTNNSNNNNNNNNNNKAKAQVQSQHSPIGICGDKVALGRRFSNNFTPPSPPPLQLSLPKMLYTRPLLRESETGPIWTAAFRGLASQPWNKTYWILVRSKQYGGQQRGYGFWRRVLTVGCVSRILGSEVKISLESYCVFVSRVSFNKLYHSGAEQIRQMNS
jgi:hypothetical protein